MRTYRRAKVLSRDRTMRPTGRCPALCEWEFTAGRKLAETTRLHRVLAAGPENGYGCTTDCGKREASAGAISKANWRAAERTL